MVSLLYGSGMRLTEVLRLRIKHVDFKAQQITVRDGKGEKDRATILSTSIIEELNIHLQRVKALHEVDLSKGFGSAHLPYVLEKKYKDAN